MFMMAIAAALLLCASCSSSEPQSTQEPGQKETTAKTIDTPEGSDPINLTSTQAAQLAYTEALKWHKDAVLWDIDVRGNSFHYDWTNTDKAWQWQATFTSYETPEIYFVYITNGEKLDLLTGERGNQRKIDINPALPKDKPLMTMKQAIGVAIQNGAPVGFLPENAAYSIVNFSEEQPVWAFGYEIPVSENAEERHFYYVDATTGKFDRAIYRNDDNDEITRADLIVQGSEIPSLSWKQDQRNTIYKFFTLLNEGNTKAALEMMDDSMKSSKNAEQMWADSFNSIVPIKLFPFIYEENEENWTDQQQAFEIKILVDDDEDAGQYGWDSGENTRWVSLTRADSSWLISEIATSPPLIND